MAQQQDNRGKYALITGATNGIGYELAKLFAEDGYNIVAVSRTPEDLEEVAHEFRAKYGVEVITITKDLFGEYAGKELYNEVMQRGLTIDVLSVEC